MFSNPLFRPFIIGLAAVFLSSCNPYDLLPAVTMRNAPEDLKLFCEEQGGLQGARQIKSEGFAVPKTLRNLEHLSYGKITELLLSGFDHIEKEVFIRRRSDVPGSYYRYSLKPDGHAACIDFRKHSYYSEQSFYFAKSSIHRAGLPPSLCLAREVSLVPTSTHRFIRYDSPQNIGGYDFDLRGFGVENAETGEVLARYQFFMICPYGKRYNSKDGFLGCAGSARIDCPDTTPKEISKSIRAFLDDTIHPARPASVKRLQEVVLEDTIVPTIGRVIVKTLNGRNIDSLPDRAVHRIIRYPKASWPIDPSGRIFIVGHSLYITKRDRLIRIGARISDDQTKPITGNIRRFEGFRSVGIVDDKIRMLAKARLGTNLNRGYYILSYDINGVPDSISEIHHPEFDSKNQSYKFRNVRWKNDHVLAEIYQVEAGQFSRYEDVRIDFP